MNFDNVSNVINTNFLLDSLPSSQPSQLNSQAHTDLLESWALEECETWGLLSDDPLTRPASTFVAPGGGRENENLHLPSSPRLPATNTTPMMTTTTASSLSALGSSSVADQIRQFQELERVREQQLHQQVRARVKL